MTVLTAKILALATQAADLGCAVKMEFRGDDDIVQAIAEIREAEFVGIVSVEDGESPRISMTADLRIGRRKQVWISAYHEREATSEEVERASHWDEQPGRRVGMTRRIR